MTTSLTLAEIETALDSGRLWASMGSSRYWPACRNGATQRWKRDASRFCIPVKVAFRTYGTIEQMQEVARFGEARADFVVTDAGVNPNNAAQQQE